MSPFLTTLGGGSARGFGRGRFRSLISSLPFVNITSITDDGAGSVTVNYVTNRSSGYDTYFYFNGNNGITYFSVNTSGFVTTSIGTCSTLNYQIRLRNKITGVFEAESSIVNYTTGVGAGVLVSSTCSGCDLIRTLSTGTCGSNYNDTISNSFNCCSPVSYLLTDTGGIFINYNFQLNASYAWELYLTLWSTAVSCGSGYSPTSGFGSSGFNSIPVPGRCNGAGNYYPQAQLIVTNNQGEMWVETVNGPEYYFPY
jgi:hypothetical protein